MLISVLFSRFSYSRLLATFVAVIFLSHAKPAFSVDPVHWRVTATDKQTKAPIEGIKFNFELTDERTSKVENKSCFTDAEGTCEVVSEPATRGFFAGGGTEALVSWDTDKYLKKAESKWESGPEKHLTVALTSKQYVTAQEEEAQRRKAGLAVARAKLLSELAVLKEDAVLNCATKDICDKMFALTEIFIAKHSDMKLQVMSPSLLQTYNPTEINKIGISAYRVPGKGSSSTIQIEVLCKDTQPQNLENNVCLLAEKLIFLKYRPFITGLLQN
jgi:hypothetical protein